MKIKIIILSLLFINVFAQFGPKNLLKVETYQSFDRVYSGGELKLALKVDIEKSWHINSNKPYDDFLIPTSLKITGDNFSLTKTSYPPAQDLTLAFSENPLSVWEEQIFIGGLIKVKENIKPGIYPLIITLNYQACNDNSCLPPNSVTDTIEVVVSGTQTPAKEINQDIFKNIDLTYTPAGIDNGQQSDDVITSTLESSGIALGLILVFLGGLALNLTPCVYPLIPITIGYFGGQSEGNTKRLAMMGLLFVIGMAVTYSVVGVITALSGAIFGALLQNTFVIIFIALIFVTLSLSMFGVYEF
ncbi:MAG: cytochrome c biogenesis protein CcdA, partial [Ignavibacteriaceae bacterium]